MHACTWISKCRYIGRHAVIAFYVVISRFYHSILTVIRLPMHFIVPILSLLYYISAHSFTFVVQFEILKNFTKFVLLRLICFFVRVWKIPSHMQADINRFYLTRTHFENIKCCEQRPFNRNGCCSLKMAAFTANVQHVLIKSCRFPKTDSNEFSLWTSSLNHIKKVHWARIDRHFWIDNEAILGCCLLSM